MATSVTVQGRTYVSTDLDGSGYVVVRTDTALPTLWSLFTDLIAEMSSTVALQSLAPSSSGNLPISNGTSWVRSHSSGVTALLDALTVSGASSLQAVTATTGQFSDTVTITKAAGVGINMISGAAASYARQTWGRNVDDAYLTIAGAAGQGSAGSVQGDVAFTTARATGQHILLSADGGNTSHIAIAPTGLVTIASGLTVTAGGILVSAGTSTFQAVTATSISFVSTNVSNVINRAAAINEGATRYETNSVVDWYVGQGWAADNDFYFASLGTSASVLHLSRATGAAIFGGSITVASGFGCNGKAAQTAAASGGTLAGVIAALVANGILSS